MKNGLTDIAGVILVLGLAFISCWAWIGSNHAIGAGWGILAVLTWLFWSWSKRPSEEERDEDHDD